jgi:hypothetical protein
MPATVRCSDCATRSPLTAAIAAWPSPRARGSSPDGRAERSALSTPACRARRSPPWWPAVG